MNNIIKLLESKKYHELSQIGLTPRTNFEGSHILHDFKHELQAKEYEKAIEILKKFKDFGINKNQVVNNFFAKRNIKISIIHDDFIIDEKYRKELNEILNYLLKITYDN